MKIFVIIPTYNEEMHISDVITKIPNDVEQIIVVDDFSNDNTQQVVSAIKDNRVILIRHEKNLGVGGAMVTGYKYCIKAGADIVVKIDGDGQMDPSLIPKIIYPLKKGYADYTKGFRFHDLENLRSMPMIRLIGNFILSFLTKIASGYWDIFDPTSGFTAIHKNTLSRLKLEKINQGYFFETNMLINLYKIQAVVYDVEISSKYGLEKSQLNPFKISLIFPILLIKAFIKRIFWRYFITDFSATSLFIIFGLPLFLFGFGFGFYTWISNFLTSTATPLGTIMVSVVPLFFGFQLLLQALVLDIHNVPKIPLQAKI